MPHRLYANGAISVNSAVALGRQVEPFRATMAFPLKCSPHSVTRDGMYLHHYESEIFSKLWWQHPTTPWISPQHHGWQSVVCPNASWADRTCTGGDGDEGVDEAGHCRARWWRRRWGVTDVRGMVQAWYFPAHFVFLTSNWGTTYVGVILMQTGLRDQLVIHLWWERTRYGFGQTTGREENETQ